MRYVVYNIYDGETQEDIGSLQECKDVADADAEAGMEEDQYVLGLDEDDDVIEVHFFNGDDWQLDANNTYQLVGRNLGTL